MGKYDAIRDQFQACADAVRDCVTRMDSFEEVEKKAAKEYGSEEAGKKVAAAVGFAKYGKKGMEKKAQAGRKDAVSYGQEIPRKDIVRMILNGELELGGPLPERPGAMVQVRVGEKQMHAGTPLMIKVGR